MNVPKDVKKSKSRVVQLTAVGSALALMLAACGDGADDTAEPDTNGADVAEPGADFEIATLRIGSNQEPSHPYFQCGWDTWEEELDGLFDVQVFPSQQLGSNVEMLDSIIAGNLEMTTTGASEIGQFWSRVGVLEAPYLFDDFDHAQRALASPEGQELLQDLEAETGLQTIGMWPYGSRHLTTTDVAVRTPEDIEGLQIRSPDNAVYLAAINAMGAAATPVAFGELYLALSQGVVDGQENPIPTIAAAGFQEVQGYISLTGHVVSTGLAVVNQDWFESLAPEQQEALLRAQEASTSAVFDCISAEEEAFLAEWEADGSIEVIRDVDFNAFADRVSSVLPPEFDESSDWNGLYETFRELAN